MPLQHWPLFSELQDCQSILIAGAGGGFDVYSGLPLYFALRAAGKTAHLANLSFAELPSEPESRITSHCVRVDADSRCRSSYFPEKTLAEWFRSRHQEEVNIYAFPQCGVIPLIEGYARLKDRLKLDAVVLVDGGTDSLMRGDEFGLGTPEEDIASLLAVNSLSAAGCKTFLACIGFGIDTFHGVCHAHFLEAVAALTRNDAFLGVTAVLQSMPEAQEFLSAVQHANLNSINRKSIVANSIASAIEGHFGDVHRTGRTDGSKLWINPLMPIYWAFHLPAVAQRNLYAELLHDTQTMRDITTRISLFRGQTKQKEWEDIPC
jgi:hypothetical protein